MWGRLETINRRPKSSLNLPSESKHMPQELAEIGWPAIHHARTVVEVSKLYLSARLLAQSLAYSLLMLLSLS